MHKIPYIIILLSILIGCNRSSGDFFINGYLNNQLKLFIDTTRASDNLNLYYQVIVGQNNQGVKVDFIAVNTYLNHPLYYDDPVKLLPVGHSLLDSSLVCFFVSSGDTYRNTLNMKALKKGKPLVDNCELCNIRPVIKSFQLNSRGDVITSISPLLNNRRPMSFYSLKYDNEKCSDMKMVLYERPKICVLFTPREIVRGGWHEESDSEMVVTYSSLLRYSNVKNEMIECQIEPTSTILDGNLLDLLSTNHYYRTADCLLPINSEVGLCWIKESDQVFPYCYFPSVKDP